MIYDENKNLADEIKNLLDQLGEGGRSIHELDKSRRKKSNAMSGELEESKELLDAAIHGQRQVEQELIDTREQVSDINASNTSLANAKRKLENDIHQM